MKPHPTTHKEGQGETTEAIEAMKKTARRHLPTHKEGQGETTEAIEAIKKTARRHKWWEGNQSDRNFKATRTNSKSKKREKRREVCIQWRRSQRPRTGRRGSGTGASCRARLRARAADDLSAEGSGLNRF